ncbi:MotA/TolQ/ExbB proton channel family protein [Myxococcota bacterium]|nr:MotA/TolQ/ExbB proton channel family protein [Myxococcota bacterium]MBU1429846.1 MotA/TolQ/ExbB proton channel family protein [Myxococcota bacterium]MBU1900664.1 MotA/TolQ/ExbB proton channel family protein [Myxococcota bacterium]
MDNAPLDLPISPSQPSVLLHHWTRLIPLTMALVGTAAVYFGVQRFVSPDQHLYTLILERGWTQPITLGLFFWGLGHVIRRLLVQMGERHALLSCREMIHDRTLDGAAVPKIIGALYPFRESLAGPLLAGILSYFRNQRPTRDEVVNVAHQELERAWGRVEGDYRALSACMWLLPLTGFLGTVVGMAAAIGSFDMVISSTAADLKALAPSVVGLATAFDTTLLALVLVVPLKLLEVGMERREQDLLEQVDRALGMGLVRALDLAVLAQQTPAEAALDRFGEGIIQVERNLKQIDAVMASIVQRLNSLPNLDYAVGDFFDAARITREHLPEIRRHLDAIKQQGDEPMIVTRRGPA